MKELELVLALALTVILCCLLVGQIFANVTNQDQHNMTHGTVGPSARIDPYEFCANASTGHPHRLLRSSSLDACHVLPSVISVVVSTHVSISQSRSRLARYGAIARGRIVVQVCPSPSSAS